MSNFFQTIVITSGNHHWSTSNRNPLRFLVYFKAGGIFYKLVFKNKMFFGLFFLLGPVSFEQLIMLLEKKRGPIPCVYVIIWLLISIQASSSPLAKMFNPMDDGFVTACPLIFIDKQLSGLVFVSPLVLLRQAAWWPVHGADYRRQGHCWPEGPGNVGMAMGKGHHHSTVSIITVTQWWKSHRKQQADWRTFTHLVGFFWRIALQVHNILQIKKKKYC